MVKLNKCKKGYTLIELVLVVAIIVILAGVMALNIATYINRAKNSKSTVDESIQSFQGKVQSIENRFANSYHF